MKKVVSIWLALVMLVCLIPMSAFASAEADEGMGQSAVYYTDHIQYYASDADDNPQRSYDAVHTLDRLTDLDAFRSTVFNAVYNCQARVDISSFNIPYTAANVEALRVFIFDCIPGIVHFESYNYYWRGSIISAIEPDYMYSASEYQQMYAKIVAAKDRMLTGIKGNSNLGDVEKALLIHDRLAMACEYDYHARAHRYDMYGALVNGITVCQGYAEAYDYLLEQAGLESYVCISNVLDHAWNIIYVNGKSYHVDVTWDDTAWDDGQKGVVGGVEHVNFLRSSNGIYNTGHWASDYDTFPTSTTYDNYFWQNSTTAFQLVGNEIYYIDNVSQSLKRYSDRSTLCSVADDWSGSYDNWSCLSNDGKYLYYSTADSIYQYNISSKKSTKFYQPTIDAQDSIYGFQYTDRTIVCDINNAEPYDGRYSRLRQISQRTYTVSFNANGGSGAPAAQIKVPGKALTLSSTVPTRSGYTFLGWATSATATAVAYQPGAQFKNNTNTTLYAVWEKDNSFKVTYNANGGSGAPAGQSKIPGTPLKLSSTIPTRSGYAFVGWGTTASATTVAYHPGSQYKNNTNITLYAIWKKGAYRVSYSANGGSGVPNAQFKIPGTPLTLSSQVPTRSGYGFVGWATSSSATTAAYQPGSQFKNNTHTTFYAVWQKGAHRISFNANGGSNAPAAQMKVPGTPLTLSMQIPTRSGYAFMGWATSASATTVAYQPGSQFKNNTPTTLYAVWKAGVYRVTYHANGGSGVPEAQFKVPGTPLTLSKQKPTRTHYRFLGWSTDQSAKAGTYATGSQFKNNCNTVLYAVWQANRYTVSYNANGGSGAPASQTKIAGTPLTLSTKRPTRTGYLFLGWSTDKNAKAGTYASGAQYKNNGDVTLYAIWKSDGTTLTVGKTHSANITTAGQEVKFSFTPTQAGVYRIYSTSDTDTQVYLYDASGNQIAFDDDGGEGLDFLMNCTLRAGVKYTFGVKYYNSRLTGTIPFYFEKLANVATVSVGSYTANITTAGGEMMYLFTPSQSGTYRIESHSDKDAQVYLHHMAGYELDMDDDGGDRMNFLLEYSMEAGVTYRYVVRFYGLETTGTIPFTLTKV